MTVKDNQHDSEAEVGVNTNSKPSMETPDETIAEASSSTDGAAPVVATAAACTIPAEDAQASPNTQTTSGLYALGRTSQKIQCPYCHQTTDTIPRTVVECMTILMSLLVFILFIPLFWLPLVMPSCKTTEHYCAHCHRKVGTTKPCE